MDNPGATQSNKPPALLWEEHFVGKANHDGKRTEELFWEEVARVSTGLISKVGTPEGKLGKEQLARSIQSGELKDKEAEVGAALYGSFDDLYGSKKAIDASDIKTFASREAASEKTFRQADDMAQWAIGRDSLNRSLKKNSDIDKSDIEQALQNKNLSGEDRAMLTSLSNNLSDFSDASGKVGKQSIEDHLKKDNQDHDFDRGVVFRHSMQSVEKAQNSPNSQKPFANMQNPIESITPDAVKQGQADDCAIKAAIAGVAALRPEEIARMIKPAGQDFEVAMPGAKAVKVKSPTAEEQGLFGQSEKGNFAELLTKAYGENVYDRASAAGKARMNSETASEWAAEDKNPVDALKAITGHAVEWGNIQKLSDGDLTGAIASAISGKRVVMLSSVEGKGRTEDGYKKSHEFTVFGLDRTGSAPIVTVRDPAGVGENNPRGTKRITLSELRKNFDQIFVESELRL